MYLVSLALRAVLILPLRWANIESENDWLRSSYGPLFFKLQKEITTLQNETSQLNVRISNSNKLRKDLESEIQDITDKYENRTAENVKLTEYKDKLKEILEDLNKLKEEYEYFQQANTLLKDDGVKSGIIRKYLPLINQQVNDYLQRMDFFINFTLDEEFNENIQTPVHEKFSYASFSEGENHPLSQPG